MTHDCQEHAKQLPMQINLKPPTGPGHIWHTAHDILSCVFSTSASNMSHRASSTLNRLGAYSHQSTKTEDSTHVADAQCNQSSGTAEIAWLEWAVLHTHTRSHKLPRTL